MTFSDLYVILAVVVLEGLLSVDNALVNASLAVQLPAKLQKRAILFGLGAGALLRVVALFAASLIIQFAWVKLVGAGYLVYLGVKHLFFTKHEGKCKSKDECQNRFWAVVVSITLADIAFSLDNVVAAVGMSPKMSVVIIGVLAGIITMAFATQLVSMLVRRYPMLAGAAYVIVALIGVTIFMDELLGVTIHETQKFLGIISIVGLTVAYEEVRMLRTRRLSQHKVDQQTLTA